MVLPIRNGSCRFIIFFSIASKFNPLNKLLHYFAYEYMRKQEAEVAVAL